jgi:hypothetical protein
MRTKDEVFGMSKKWMAETAGIQKDHPIFVVVRDNAGENTSKELNDHFTEHGVKNYFSTPYEQWHNGLAEAFVNSVTMLARMVMAESGLRGQFWFSATMHGVNCRYATYKERLGTTPHEKLYGKKKNVSQFRP